MIHIVAFTQIKLKFFFNHTIFLFQTLTIAFLLPVSMSLIAQVYCCVAYFKIPYPEILTAVYFMNLKFYQKNKHDSEELYRRERKKAIRRFIMRYL